MPKESAPAETETERLSPPEMEALVREVGDARLEIQDGKFVIDGGLTKVQPERVFRDETTGEKMPAKNFLQALLDR